MMEDRNKQQLDDLTAMDTTIPLVDTLINWIKKKKLETPAMFFLEMHRPLFPLAHPAAIFCGMFIAPFYGPDYYEKIEALRNPAVLDALLDRIAARPSAGTDATTHKEAHI
jgi:hypothetical protein